MTMAHFFGHSQVVLFGLTLIFEHTISLKLVSLVVPPYVPLGTHQTLSCQWQLGAADTLYAVKWYKDGKEFFRHVPKDVERKRMFPLTGVDVESSTISACNISVTLAAAVLETGGRYRCEVSGERPLFVTVSQHEDMNIVALPTHGPIITGLKSRYRVGDSVKVSCSCGPSRPHAELTWYINGEPASKSAVHPSAIEWDNGLVVASTTLEFRVEDHHFGPSGMKVKCLATIIPVYWRSNEENALQDMSILEKFVRTIEHRPTRADRVHASQGSDLTANGLVFGGILVLLNRL